MKTVLSPTESRKHFPENEEPLIARKFDGALFVRQMDGRYLLWWDDPRMREQKCMQHRHAREDLDIKHFTVI